MDEKMRFPIVADDVSARIQTSKTLVPWAQRRTDRLQGLVMGLRRYRTSAIGLSIKDSMAWKDDKGGAFGPERHVKKKKTSVPTLTSLPFHQLEHFHRPFRGSRDPSREADRVESINEGRNERGDGSGDEEEDQDQDGNGERGDIARKRRSAFESFRTRGVHLTGVPSSPNTFAGSAPLDTTASKIRAPRPPSFGPPSFGPPSLRPAPSASSRGPFSFEMMASAWSGATTTAAPPAFVKSDLEGKGAMPVVDGKERGPGFLLEPTSGMEQAWKWKVDSLDQSHEKKIICPHCGTPFTSQTNLRRHMKIHSGLKPYACTHPGCNKEFLRRCDLKTHMRTHTKERPYVCAVEGCGRTFTTCSNLRRHERTGHGIEN